MMSNPPKQELLSPAALHSDEKILRRGAPCMAFMCPNIAFAWTTPLSKVMLSNARWFVEVDHH